tara:strand:+ start:14 stop:535 length:522 start_codon:yes stop_codon:yes gene_type:complete
MIIWFTGLSGAGKSTLAEHMYSKVKPIYKNTVYLDGDILRKCFSNEKKYDYTHEGRRENAERIHALSLLLDKQEINVICAIQLIFNDIRSLNREIFSRYLEIHVKCKIETLKRRDTKNLFKSYTSNKANNIVGIDIPYPEPNNFDYEINTDESIKFTLSKVDQISKNVINKFY